MSICWIFCLILSWICSGSNSLLNLNRPPVFTIEPISTIALKGRPVTLNCNVDGNPPPQVQWRRNGKSVPSPADTRRLLLLSGSLHITKVINDRGNKPDVGVYQCMATNQVGTTVSRKVKLSVAVLSKKFQEHPQNETVVEGTTARFSCKTRKAIPDPTVTWEKDGTPIDSANKRFVTLPRGILQISDVKMSDVGKYRCVAQNMAKTRHSSYARLTVKRVAKGRVVELNFTVPPSNTTSITGETAIMECVTTGKPLPVVTWKKLGNRQKLQDVSRGTLSGISNLRIMGVTEKDSGQYVCVATAAGKTIISSAWLFVKEPPHFTSRPEGEIAEQEGLSVRLLCSARGSPFPKITWLKNGRVLHYNSRISFFRGAKELKIERTVVSDSGVYQCFAENDVGNIQVSSRIRVRRSVVQPPAPTNLAITATSPMSLHLTWRRPIFSLTIQYYSIHCTPSGGPRALEIVAPDNSTFYKLGGLKANTEYACSVKGYSQKGIGDRSKVVKVKTLEDAPTGAPNKVVVISETPDSLDVSWNPPYKSEQNGVIINYFIRYVKDSQSAVRTVYVPGNDRMVTINKLDKGLTYAVQVAAQTSGGIGPFSKNIDGTVLVTPNEVISAPLFARPMLNSSAVRVLWSVPLYGAHKVVEYRLYYKKTSGNAQQGPVAINKQKKEYILNKLDPITQYTLKLRAWDGKQAGKTATIVVKTMPEKALLQLSAPPPPQNIHCKADSSTSLHMTWDETRKDIASYTVKYEIKGNKDKSVTKMQDTSFKHILLMGLTPGKEYTVTVQSHRSIKRATPGQFSKAANGCITHEAEPSSPPLNVKFRYVTTISVELMWIPPKQPNGKLTNYKILYSVNKTQDDKDWKTKVVLPVTEIFQSRKFETARLAGLEPNVTYYVKIFARNNIGYGPPSEPITIKVAQENLIGKPLQNIEIEVTHSQSADVYWGKPTKSKNKVTRYVLLYSDDLQKPEEQWKSEMLDMDVSSFERIIKILHIELLNLKPSVTYYVKMRAEYSAGFSPWSRVVQFKVPDDSWRVPTRTTTTTTTTTSQSPNGMVEPKEQTTNEEFAVKLGIIIGCVITAFFIVILALFIIWRNPCRYAYPHQPKQDLELTNSKLPGNGIEPSVTQHVAFPHEVASQKGKEESSLSSSGVGNCQCYLLHRSHPQNLKPLNHCNGTSQVPTANGKVFTMNGSAHPGSISSYNINTNGSISSQLNGGVNKMVPFEVQSDGRQYSVVVIERRINSNSLSVDV